MELTDRWKIVFPSRMVNTYGPGIERPNCIVCVAIDNVVGVKGEDRSSAVFISPCGSGASTSALLDERPMAVRFQENVCNQI